MFVMLRHRRGQHGEVKVRRVSSPLYNTNQRARPGTIALRCAACSLPEPSFVCTASISSIACEPMEDDQFGVLCSASSYLPPCEEAVWLQGDPQVPEVHGAAHQEAAFPQTGARGVRGPQDWVAFPGEGSGSPAGSD